MADPNEIMQAARAASENFDSEDREMQRKSMIAAQKLGFGIMELKQLRYANSYPDDPNSLEIKHKLFDKIAESQPAMQIGRTGGLPFKERWTVKNLIQEDKDLQERYLASKDIQTRRVGDQLEWKRPGESSFKPIEFDGIDPWDFFDVTGDAVKGAAEGILMGTRGLGLLAGPIGVGGAAAIGAGAGGALEIARQGLGKIAGVRKEFNLPLIGQEAATSALFGSGFRALGLAGVNAGRNAAAAGAARSVPRQDAEGIRQSFNNLGIEPTPAQLLKDKAQREIEDGVIRNRTNWYSTTRKLKKQAEQIRDTSDSVADNLMDTAAKRHFGVSASEIEKGGAKAQQMYLDYENEVMKFLEGLISEQGGRLSTDVAEQVRKTIGEKLGSRLAEATENYYLIETALKDRGLRPNMSNFIRSLNSMRKQPNAALDSAIDSWIETAKSIKTIDELNNFKTLISDQLPSATKSIRGVGRQAIKNLHELRDQTFADAILAKVKEVEKSGSKIAKSEVDYLEDLSYRLAKANKIYREVNEAIDGVVKRPGAQNWAKSAADKLKEFGNAPVEKVYEMVSAKNDVAKARWLKENFPEEFRLISENKMAKIWLDAAEKDKNVSEYILTRLQNLTDSEKSVLLGPNADKTLLENMQSIKSLRANAKDDAMIADIISRAMRKTETTQARSKQFSDVILNQVAGLPEAQKILIFGEEGTKKLKDLTKVYKYKLDLQNPSTTSRSIWDWKGMFADLRAERNIVKKYERQVLNNATAGKSLDKYGKILQSPTTFGTTEAARQSLLLPGLQIPYLIPQDNKRKDK